MKESELSESMLKKSFINKIRIKCQLIYRILIYHEFILFGEKDHEVSFMSTMSVDKTMWHLRAVMKKFKDHQEGENLVNDASNIINGVQ